MKNEELVDDFRDLDPLISRLAALEDVAAPVPEVREEIKSSRPEKPEPVAERILPKKPTQKQIWEIEPSEDAEVDEISEKDNALLEKVALKEASSISITRARITPNRDVEEVSAPPASGRVKTRILGFHTPGADTDVFSSTSAATAKAGEFPAGWVVVVDGPGRGASFSIGSGVSVIGRGEDQTISLDFGDMSVSRENHALIAYDEEQNKFFIGHGGKTNIVRLNGNPVLATEPLKTADLIRIGKTTLRFVALCGEDFSWVSDENGQSSDASES